jgi:hypothetical protein
MNVTPINPGSKGTLSHYVAAAIPMSKCRLSPVLYSCFSVMLYVFLGSSGDHMGSHCVQPEEERPRGTPGQLIEAICVAYNSLEACIPEISTQTGGRL